MDKLIEKIDRLSSTVKQIVFYLALDKEGLIFFTSLINY